MSIYDDLADSGYMNQDELRRQYLATNNSNYDQLERSMEATNKFVDFNQYDIQNTQATLENIQVDNRFKHDGSLHQGNMMAENNINLKQDPSQRQQNPNFKKQFNPNLHVIQYQQQQLPFDDYQMLSAIKSPLSGHGNQSNLDIQQNLFGKLEAGDLEVSNVDDQFLKDSTTGLPYNQPNNNQNVQYALLQYQQQQQLELKTGRFASHTNNEHQNQQVSKPSAQMSYFEDDINRFKNNNDQIQQLLMQLQTNNQVGDPFQFNSIDNVQESNRNYQHLPDSIHQVKQTQVNQENDQFNYHDPNSYQRSLSQNNSHKHHQHNPSSDFLSKNKPTNPTNYDLIKDNSILELAKLKHNSGNSASNNVTPHSAYDNQDILSGGIGDEAKSNADFISRDASYLQNRQFSNPYEDMNGKQIMLDNLDFFKMPSVNTNMPTNLNTVGNSIISFDKFTPNYPALRNAVPGQSFVMDEKLQHMLGGMGGQYKIGPDGGAVSANCNNTFDKENIDKNISYVQVPHDQARFNNQYNQQQMPQNMPQNIYGQNKQNPLSGNPSFIPPQYNKQLSNPLIKTDQSLIQDNFQADVYAPQFKQANQMQQNMLQQQYTRQVSAQEIKRKEIMSKFDDIPIKDLNKAENYQEKLMNDDIIAEPDEDGSTLSLVEKIEHQKWKVRMSAYKEINYLFYNEYSKDCLRAKGQLDETDAPEYDDHGNLLNKPFDLYGPLLHKIITDSNLVAQYEGLNCLFGYVKFAPDIKSVVHQVSTILLEKIQHNKPNFKEITIKIILNIFKKEKSLSFLPEILKRFKNKNFKIATFAVEAVHESLKQNCLLDENSQRSIFKVSQENLSNPTKELKEAVTGLIEEIYKNCEDDLNTFMRNLKNLRPVQEKDIKDQLSEVQKHQRVLIQLFKNQSVPAAAAPQTHLDGFSPKAKKTIIDDKNILNTQEDDYEIANQTTEKDLTLLVPDNFFEIPYLTQINVKKKGIEAFNTELEKLVVRKANGGVQVINKDYSQIYNVVTHMLEDSNSLVFMEGIKTVEYLCILMGRNIKQQKMRQFIALLTDKYKETKSGPIAAVNKALQTIIKKQTMPANTLFDHLINTLAHNSKNARVKQLILEKCDVTIQEDNNLKQDENTLLSIFKQVKDKLIGLIQKDTNANVRDAAVALIVTFKVYTSFNQSNANIVDEAINGLPKYRIAEISKQASEKALNIKPSHQDAITHDKESNQVRKESAKPEKNIINSQPQAQQKQESQSKEDFFYSGRNISGQYQIHLAEIILSIKKIAQYPSNTNISLTQLQERWDASLENLGETGLKEVKSVIIGCVHWLFSHHSSKISNNIQLIETILGGLVKKIYCIERSVETNPKTCISQELNQSVQLSLMSLKWVTYHRQIETILNVLMSSALNINQFIDSLLASFNYFSQQSEEDELVSIVQFCVRWLQDKIEILVSKGIKIDSLEEFRGTILSTYLEAITNDQIRDSLIRVMIDFKFEIDKQSQNVLAHNQNEEQQLKGLKKGKTQYQVEEDGDLKISDLNNQNKQHNQVKSIGEQFLELIDSDFQAGLQMIKGFQTNPHILDFQNKEIVFMKVLSIAAMQTKNPVQKQQQAFSMKALLWMKEEIFGVEDCYQFTSAVMMSYARAEMEARDSSVELYLLNNWVKQLRLKDLIDRVSMVCQEDSQVFKFIFNWLMMHSLNGNQTDQWAIEDFRKISLLLSKNLFDDQVTEFFEICVSKFGIQKVQDFMEIQLMNTQKDYNQFVSWFALKFQNKINLQIQPEQIRAQTAQSNKNPSIVQKDFDYELREAQITNPTSIQAISNYQNTEESMLQSDRNNRDLQNQSNLQQHSKLYQQMREKRKNSHQRKQQDQEQSSINSQNQQELQQQQDGLSKYDQIINRLEAQLQQEKQNWNSNPSATKRRQNVYGMINNTDNNSSSNSNEKESKVHFKEDMREIRKYEGDCTNQEEEIKQKLENNNYQFYKSNSSNYYQSDKSNRYNIVKTDEDEDLEDSLANLPSQPNQNNKNTLQQSHGYQERSDKLKESEVKENLWKMELDKLNQDRLRLEQERQQLLQTKNKESAEWRDRYEEIRQEHEDVVGSLKEANKCYLTQVSENEELKNQLKEMQEQHKTMMRKFEQFEEKLSQQQEKQILEKYNRQREQEVTIVKQEQLALVERVFKDYQLQSQNGDEHIGTKKIQELLLNFSDREETQRIGVSLYVHYQGLKTKDSKFKLLKGLSLALESEDVLFALPLETYKTVLDFNLKVFANEKALLDKNNIRQSSQSMSRPQANEQNEITMEAQKLVSKLLNSKEFTTSLVTLFQILRASMPDDLATDLTEEQKHYIRVIMRCISRITKALHSENPDLIRAFDVLIEMQKIFIKNPPESLREDLPCLQDFDYVYRCLKEVSDKLMELQPHKVVTFLEFVASQPENAFIKYMNSVMEPMMRKKQEKSKQHINTYEGDEEEYEDDEMRYHNSTSQQC